MKRGEVWRVSIPLAAGHAQSGERPAFLIQDEQFTVSLPTVLIVPLTSTLTASRFAGTLLISPDGSNGLTVPSVALVFQLRVLDKRACLYRLGTLSSQLLDQIFAMLDRLTGR